MNGLQFLSFQIEELGENFKPDLFGLTGLEQSADKWKAREIRELILKQNPKAIINSRLQGYGDYSTPEQGCL